MMDEKGSDLYIEKALRLVGSARDEFSEYAPDGSNNTLLEALVMAQAGTTRALQELNETLMQALAR